MSTPHNSANPGEFAKTVLMPGDPLRAKYIAENFLENAKLVNNVRGVQGYTGTYHGVPVTVMASGMGMPSMGIYSAELFQFYGVENIIRIGSTGSIQPDVPLRAVVIGQAACTDSNWASQYHLPGTFAPIANYGLLETAVGTARELGLPVCVGNVLSSDRFYDDEENVPDEWQAKNLWKKMGVLCIEMEGAALYMNAARFGKKALVICTVSDDLVHGEALSAEERQLGFNNMITLAMETAVKLDKE